MRERLRPWSWALALASLVLLATVLSGTAIGASNDRAAVTASSSTTNLPRGSNLARGSYGSVSPFGSWTPAAPYPRTNVRYAFADLGEMLYVIGGVSDGTRITDVNRYNATTNAWTPLAPIPVASEAPCGAHWNGKIYVAEGDTGNSFRIYDIATNTLDRWVRRGPVAAATAVPPVRSTTRCT